MASVIDGFRWCTFGNRAPLFWSGQLISMAVVVGGLLVGYRYFRYSERTFADVI
jgi:lipopolysaccharide transport system permease protein